METAFPISSSDLFLAKPIPNGYSWTLTSHLGDILARAEERFGQRNREWSILGVEIGPECPQVWYPGNRKHVVVQISREVHLKPHFAIYQLAHEAVHLLDPSGARRSNNIEEGLAEHFAGYYQVHVFGRELVLPNLPSYMACRKATEALLALDIDCIRYLRAMGRKLWESTPECLMECVPKLSQPSAEFLSAPFRRE
jgi:hypothetical protein